MSQSDKDTSQTLVYRFLGAVEALGNRLPDPAMLFLFAMLLVWLISWLFAGFAFSVPSLDGARELSVENQLSGSALATFLATMVKTFTGFAPLGVVLVAMLGVGVAEHTGFINAGLKSLLSITPAKLLTPMLLLVAIVSHTAADAGYVLVIPSGRHYLLCRRPTPTCRYSVCICWCIRRLQCQLHPIRY